MHKLTLIIYIFRKNNDFTSADVSLIKNNNLAFVIWSLNKIYNVEVNYHNKKNKKKNILQKIVQFLLLTVKYMFKNFYTMNFCLQSLEKWFINTTIQLTLILECYWNKIRDFNLSHLDFCTYSAVIPYFKLFSLFYCIILCQYKMHRCKFY